MIASVYAHPPKRNVTYLFCYQQVHPMKLNNSLTSHGGSQQTPRTPLTPTDICQRHPLELRPRSDNVNIQPNTAVLDKSKGNCSSVQHLKKFSFQPRPATLTHQSSYSDVCSLSVFNELKTL